MVLPWLIASQLVGESSMLSQALARDFISNCRFRVLILRWPGTIWSAHRIIGGSSDHRTSVLYKIVNNMRYENCTLLLVQQTLTTRG